MTGRYKGATQKGAPDMGDLETLARIHRELQDMGAAINLHHPCQHPIAAARATVFAAWTEISGAAQSWSFPTSEMLPNGLARRFLRQSQGSERGEPASPSTEGARNPSSVMADNGPPSLSGRTPLPP